MKVEVFSESAVKFYRDRRYHIKKFSAVYRSNRINVNSPFGLQVVYSWTILCRCGSDLLSGASPAATDHRLPKHELNTSLISLMKGVRFLPRAVQRNWVLSTHANVIGKAVMYVSMEQAKLVWPLWYKEHGWLRIKGLTKFLLKIERSKGTRNPQK
jgi:hypothetical protein